MAKTTATFTRLQVESMLNMLSCGRYELDGVYAVDHTDSGWRWYRMADPSVGGEWRRSKREAVLDLTHYLNEHDPMEACERLEDYR